MLSETFFFLADDEERAQVADGDWTLCPNVDDPLGAALRDDHDHDPVPRSRESQTTRSRRRRAYLKDALVSHSIWREPSFWEHSLAEAALDAAISWFYRVKLRFPKASLLFARAQRRPVTRNRSAGREHDRRRPNVRRRHLHVPKHTKHPPEQSRFV